MIVLYDSLSLSSALFRVVTQFKLLSQCMACMHCSVQHATRGAVKLCRASISAMIHGYKTVLCCQSCGQLQAYLLAFQLTLALAAKNHGIGLAAIQSNIFRSLHTKQTGNVPSCIRIPGGSPGSQNQYRSLGLGLYSINSRRPAYFKPFKPIFALALTQIQRSD